MSDTDKIDQLYEAEFNPLDDVARAAFRRGYEIATQRAIGMVEAYMSDSGNYSTGVRDKFKAGARVTCAMILSDLIA